jgi:membrane-associated phospholipid phosphatase
MPTRRALQASFSCRHKVVQTMSAHAYAGHDLRHGMGRPRLGPTERRGVARALCIAALCLLALALIWVVAELVPQARARDSLALRDFVLLSGPHVSAVADFLLSLLDPPMLILWGIALVLCALARARVRVALAVALVLGLAPLSADALKPLLAHPHSHVGAVYIDPASWQSGHATAALALGLCAVLVAPRRLRLAVGALGAAFSLAVGCSLLIRAWHMPSDVLGGYAMAALWMALAVAALRATDARRGRGGDGDGGAPAWHGGPSIS